MFWVMTLMLGSLKSALAGEMLQANIMVTTNKKDPRMRHRHPGSSLL
jgi:hypothetical protein